LSFALIKATEEKKEKWKMAKQKAPPVVSDINVTPMVDVMLVLLIIFMVITPMLSKGKDVTKVRTKNDIKMVEADKEDAVLIAITRDGKVYLSPGNSMVMANDLGSKVKDLQTNRSDKTVYIKADARARFSAVTEVIDNLRTAQVDSVGLITENIPDRKKSSGL
jgi:biopolymer transport protein ExbD